MTDPLPETEHRRQSQALAFLLLAFGLAVAGGVVLLILVTAGGPVAG